MSDTIELTEEEKHEAEKLHLMREDNIEGKSNLNIIVFLILFSHIFWNLRSEVLTFFAVVIGIIVLTIINAKIVAEKENKIIYSTR
jgi:hypothetical protein